MTEQLFTTRTEPVEPWQPIGCISCMKPATDQETAFVGEKKLPVSIRHCGDPSCKQYATDHALHLATLPEVQEMAR